MLFELYDASAFASLADLATPCRVKGVLMGNGNLVLVSSAELRKAGATGANGSEYPFLFKSECKRAYGERDD
ncbi:MAG: hypothetical protein V3S69_07970 [Dehalococcoidales bacterium]